MNIHRGRMTITLGYKNITYTLFSKGVEVDCGCERETDRDKDRLSSWPYHAVLSSKPHLALLILGWGVLNELLLQWGTHPLTGTFRDWPNLFWPQAETDCISHGDLHISFYNTQPCATMWLLLFIYTGMSCAEKSDSSSKGQYATLVIT